jgi:hypothetical protein
MDTGYMLTAMVIQSCLLTNGKMTMKRATRKKIKQLSIALALVLVIPATVLASSPPTIPAIPLLVYGDVTIDNQPAPVGTKILAEIEGAEVAVVITTTQGKYFIEIPDGADCAADKDIIFKVDDIVNDTPALCQDVEEVPSIKFDLTVVSPPPVTPPSPPGGSTSGSLPPPANPSPELITGDANGDQKLIFWILIL